MSEGTTNEFTPKEIPEFDKQRLVDFLSGSKFQNSLNSIITRTRKAGFEQGLTVVAGAKSGKLSIRETTSVDIDEVGKGLTEYVEQGLRPLISIHTHPATNKVDLEERRRFYQGSYFLPSPEDMEMPNFFIDEESKLMTYNFVAAMIVGTSTPRVWIWQVPNERIQKYAAEVMDNFVKEMSQDVTERDVQDVIAELKGVGLNLYVGNLDAKNPAKSFADLYDKLSFHVGYLN